ncbi:MAG: hypothetical protein ACE15D_00575 [Candidatus Eisenbacteria bacterium]
MAAPSLPSGTAASAPSLRRWRPAAVRLALWILIGLALRTIALSGDGLWIDEGYTAWTAHLPAREHEIARSHDDAPPLYYAIARAVVPRLPPTDASVRALSAAAGVAGTVWLALAPPVPGAREAAVAFFAAGTYGVHYGRQARSYAVLMLWTVVLLTASARVMQGRSPWWFVVVAASEALALWTHNVAAALVGGANLAWLLAGLPRPRGWLLAQAAAFLAWLPYLVRAMPQLSVHATLNVWIEKYWERVPLAIAPLASLEAFTSGARVWPNPPVPLWMWRGPGSTVLAILAFAAVVLLGVAALRGARRREARLAAGFTLGPLVAMTVLSLVTTPSYILGRTDAVAYPGFVLWMAIGAVSVERRWLRRAAVGVLALSTILGTASGLPLGDRGADHDRQVGRAVAGELRPGDWIAYVGLSRPSIDYYVSGGRPGCVDPVHHRLDYPAIFGDNPAAVYPTPAESLEVWNEEARDVRRSFERQAAPGAKIWFVGPIQPGAPREATAEDLPYPGSLLAYALNGLRPLDPLIRLRGDAVGVDWIAFAVERDSLIPESELREVEAAP